MNTYTKFAPNVFVAKCEEKHEKGDIITLTTKYGKEHENEVHNYLGQTKDGYHLYSITRTDGFNAQKRAEKKAERLRGYAVNAANRSKEAYKKTDLSEEATGIPFGQPILVGHHSERKHRKILERADNAMRKSIEEGVKAQDYENRAEYWENKAKNINLSLPESIEYLEYKLYLAKKKHQLLKDKPELREHSYSLTYANKEVKEITKNFHLAIKLWGDEKQLKQLAQIENEKREAAQSNTSNKTEDKIKSLGGFFAFNINQFKEGYAKSVEDGHLQQGEKVTHVKAGLYIPVKNLGRW